MTTLEIPPFVAALGAELERASPAVRRHLAMSGGPSLRRGTLRRLWRRGWAGRIAARLLHIDGDPGAPFELHNEIVPDASEGIAMLWRGTHGSGPAAIRRLGSMRFVAATGLLVDSIGPNGRLEVELAPSVEDRALVLRSRRQRLRVAGILLPLPRWVFGGAEVREWEEPEGALVLRLSLRHPLLGPLAGYEAVMREVPAR